MYPSSSPPLPGSMKAGADMIVLQRVLVERPPVRWELHTRALDWKGVVREGVSCYAQVDERVQGRS